MSMKSKQRDTFTAPLILPHTYIYQGTAYNILDQSNVVCIGSQTYRIALKNKITYRCLKDRRITAILGDMESTQDIRHAKKSAGKYSRNYFPR